VQILQMPHLAAPVKKANDTALAYLSEICALDDESGFGGLAAQMRST
jgi:hypothetical protein